MSEWISVEDRLPKRSKPNETERVLAWISHPSAPGPYCPYMVAYAETDNTYPVKVMRWICANTDNFIYNNVTHWMPLPEPLEAT